MGAVTPVGLGVPAGTAMSDERRAMNKEKPWGP